MLPYFVGKHNRIANELPRTLHDPTLANIFENLFMPDSPLWFLYMLFGLLAHGQMGLLTQGCEGFVRPIEARDRALGGQITYNATVEKVPGRAALSEVEGPTGPWVFGWQTAKEHRGDAVIVGRRWVRHPLQPAGGPLPRQRAPGAPSRLAADQAVGDAQLRRGARVCRRAPLHHLPSGRADRRRPEAQVEMLTVRLLNYSPHFAPAGKTIIQPSFEADWDYLGELATDGSRGV